MSRTERFALSGALLLVLLQAAGSLSAPFAEALEYRRAALYAQPLRALTAHWVHINWPHALINAAAWVIVARLFVTELSPPRQLVVLASASVGISVGLALFYPQIEWYRGFSGVLHALFIAGTTIWLIRTLAQRETRTVSALWLPGALAVGGWIKVLIEQPTVGATPYAAWLGAATVPQAHLLGAACGTVVGLLFARSRGSGALAKTRQEYEKAE